MKKKSISSYRASPARAFFILTYLTSCEGRQHVMLKVFSLEISNLLMPVYVFGTININLKLKTTQSNHFIMQIMSTCILNLSLRCRIHVQYNCIVRFQPPCVGVTGCLMVSHELLLRTLRTLLRSVWSVFCLHFFC